MARAAFPAQIRVESREESSSKVVDSLDARESRTFVAFAAKSEAAPFHAMPVWKRMSEWRENLYFQTFI